jgi:hypothetical protein
MRSGDLSRIGPHESMDLPRNRIEIAKIDCRESQPEDVRDLSRIGPQDRMDLPRNAM